MSRRWSFAFVLAWVTLTACSDEDVALDSGGVGADDVAPDDSGVEPTGGETGGDDTGGYDTGGTVGEEPEEFTCGSAYRQPDDERVLFDVDVACSHTMFARYGIGAATSEAVDALYVATAGFEESWVFRIDRTEAVPLPAAPRLTQQRVHVTLDAEDALVVAGVADVELPDITVARHDEGSDAWSLDAVGIPGGVETLVDLDGAADGTARMWMRSAENVWSVARRVDDAWSVADAVLPEGATAPHFTIARDGSEVAATHLPDTDLAWRLAARTGDEATLLLGDVLAEHPSSCIPVQSSIAGELDESLPAYAFASARADAIVIDTPNGIEASIVVPDTALRVSSCPTQQDAMACLPECRDVSTGRLDDAFAAVRTDDGTMWLAWVHASVDERLTYVEACDDVKGSCWCDEVVTDEASSWAVKLVAVRPDGTIEPALEIPLADNPCGGDAILAPGDALALHAHGSRLALVVRTSGSDVLPGYPFVVRALLFDGSAR